jgi:hypothetical protein
LWSAALRNRPPPRDGAAVVRAVAAKVPEVGNGFEMNVSGIGCPHLALNAGITCLEKRSS